MGKIYLNDIVKVDSNLITVSGSAKTTCSTTDVSSGSSSMYAYHSEVSINIGLQEIYIFAINSDANLSYIKQIEASPNILFISNSLFGKHNWNISINNGTLKANIGGYVNSYGNIPLELKVAQSFDYIAIGIG